MEGIFKDKDREEGSSITNLILQVCQLLRQDLQELIDGIEEVKP